MKSVIVGTAGHIDHGKTALVRALTGIDADRLEEEKRRGITIDLGFAHLDLAADDGTPLRLGFVDVPGHERFVRNMLAGVGGIDLVLLVIAADSSIQPQTREHFEICRLLNVQRGITVLTKADLVDAETLDVVRMEVEEFLRGSFLDPHLTLQPSPIIAVSAKTGQGIAELKRLLAQQSSATVARDSSALTRLPIDRVFTMKGFGTVVTGTLVSGSVRKEDELEIYPTGQRVRVRGVQVHSAAAEVAEAGQRTAVNLAGVTVEQLSRGMTLAPVGAFRTTLRLDVALMLLPSSKPLKNRARVHLHAHTVEGIAEVVLGEGRQIASGTKAFARLRLADATLLLPGDRFIIRQFSPVVTLGGGLVLDAAPLPKTKQYTLDAFFTVLNSGDPTRILLTRLARRGDTGLPLADMVAESGWAQEFLQSTLASPLHSGEVTKIADRYVLSKCLEALCQRLITCVGAFHSSHPLVAGIGKDELREELQAHPEVFTFAVQRLAAENKLAISGELVHLPGQGVVLRDEESASKQIIESAFATAGLQVPTLKEVLLGLKIDEARARKLVTLLLRDKTLVKVTEDLVFHHAALDSLRRLLAARKAQSSTIDVGIFKEMTGVSRKYAIPLLEYLDRERVTRRVGNERIIL
jgi:selenocysteine-specific elongation factor